MWFGSALTSRNEGACSRGVGGVLAKKSHTSSGLPPCLFALCFCPFIGSCQRRQMAAAVALTHPKEKLSSDVHRSQYAFGPRWGECVSLKKRHARLLDGQVVDTRVAEFGVVVRFDGLVDTAWQPREHRSQDEGHGDVDRHANDSGPDGELGV